MKYALVINGKVIEKCPNAETLKRHGAIFKARNKALDVKVVRYEARTVSV